MMPSVVSGLCEWVWFWSNSRNCEHALIFDYPYFGGILIQSSETSSKWFAEIADCDDFQNRTQRIIWLTSRARRIWLITKLVKGTYLNLIMGLAIPLILKMSFFLISNSNCVLGMIQRNKDYELCSTRNISSDGAWYSFSFAFWFEINLDRKYNMTESCQ